MKKILSGAVAITLASWAGGIDSRAASAPPAAATATGDSEKIAEGEALATRGSAGVTPCEQCHGTHGEGNGDVGFLAAYFSALPPPVPPAAR